MGDNVSKETRSKIMARVKSKNTLCEVKLRKALREKGIVGYRIHVKMVGHPDIVFLKRRIAIFCASDFWHGKSGYPKTNQSYWRDKLQRNIRRDLEVNEILRATGWRVIRFSEKEILKETNKCVEIIISILHGDAED